MKKPHVNWNNTSREPEGIRLKTEDRRMENEDRGMKTGGPYIYQVRIYANR